MATALRCALLSVALLGVSTARAVVTNGGFEDGSFAGWTLSGDVSFSGVAPAIGRAGTYGAYFGASGTTSLSQVVATQAGTLVQVRFWLALDDSAVPNSFSWSWNGATQSSLSNVAAFGWVAYSASFVAAASTATLQFSFSNPQSFWRLDDVAVTAVVPEPASALLMALGVAGLLCARLRRRAD